MGALQWGMTWVLAAFFRPLAALVLFGVICLPFRIAVQRWMKPGKLKSFLLTPIGKKTARN